MGPSVGGNFSDVVTGAAFGGTSDKEEGLGDSFGAIWDNDGGVATEGEFEHGASFFAGGLVGKFSVVEGIVTVAPNEFEGDVLVF